MDEELMSIDSPTSMNNPSLEMLSSAFLRQQSVPQSKYAQLLAVLEEMGKIKCRTLKFHEPLCCIY